MEVQRVIREPAEAVTGIEGDRFVVDGVNDDDLESNVCARFSASFQCMHQELPTYATPRESSIDGQTSE